MAENDLFNTVLSKAMALCSRREFCLKDISNKLQLWNVGSTESEKILNILIKENFINESRYATAFVKDKFRYNKWGKVKIGAHLKAKNISPYIIQSALDSIDNTDYTEMLGKLLDSHRKTVKAKNRLDLNAKLLRYGLSKGFESALLFDILNDTEY